MKYLSQAIRLIALSVTAAASLCLPAVAAPFCIQNEVISPLCIYYDAQQCAEEARRQGAACAANPAELHLKRGVGQYCLVTSSQVSVCAYADRQACELDATRQHGACTNAGPAAPARTPDPYSPINGQ